LIKPEDESLPSDQRTGLERRVAESSRVMVAESNAIAALFSSRHGIAANDFRALLHVFVMQSAGEDVGPRDIASLLGLSGGAVTYLAYRLGHTGHLEQEPHPSDRRRVRYRYTDGGMDVAQNFFSGLGRHMHTAFSELTDVELEAADKAGRAFITALKAWRAELEG
jgi:DNA-binding MarR family transcriptional regulator